MPAYAPRLSAEMAELLLLAVSAAQAQEVE
jgi:hypothetical protein